MLITQLFKTNSLAKQDFKLLEDWYKLDNSEKLDIMTKFAAAINRNEKGRKIKNQLKRNLKKHKKKK